jgi:uncharacterized membrane protein
MRGIDGIGNWVLVIMAAASLISMIAAFNNNTIVSHDLYLYGLKFSYGWAIGYWDMIGIIFAMAWLNIIIAIAFQIYRIRTVRKYERQSTDIQNKNWLKSKNEQESLSSRNWDKIIYEAAIAKIQTEPQKERKQAQ